MGMSLEDVRFCVGMCASAVLSHLKQRLSSEGGSIGHPLESRDLFPFFLDLEILTQRQQAMHDLPRRVESGRQITTARNGNGLVDLRRQRIRFCFCC